MSHQDQPDVERGDRALHRNRQAPAPSTLKLVKRARLHYVSTDALTIRRQRHGRGFRYLDAQGAALSAKEARRLTAITTLRQLPGRRLFQYRNGSGELRAASARRERLLA